MLALFLACAPAPESTSTLNDAFDAASVEYDVPRDLLVATSYALTRLDARSGMLSTEGGVGVMDLRVTGDVPSIAKAAALIQVDSEELELDQAANIRGAAAILATMADNRELAIGKRIETYQDWYPIIAQYSGESDPLLAEGFAYQVFTFMSWGFVEEVDGETILVPAHSLPFLDDRASRARSSLIAQFIPASSSNYTDSSRSSVDRVVIHTMEGSYSGSISWFQNSSASASAHYMVRSSDGEITQMVDEEDTAWHAGHWDTNSRSIGIEHEGYISDPGTWYTEAMMAASAQLTRDICDRYGIPIDRSHIIGHNEVPGCSNPSGGGSSCHTDPGSGWDWNKYIDRVKSAGGGSGWGPTGSLVDGDKSGWFEATVSSDKYGLTKVCKGPVNGKATSGHLYVTANCHLEHEGRSGDFHITWSGEENGAVLPGTVVVDAYSDPFEGSIQSDGSVVADLSGAHDLGGDIGVVRYEATLLLDP